MKRDVAEKVVASMENINSILYGLLPYLKEHSNEDEYAKLQREIARISNGIDQNLYPIVLEQYPDLDPLKNSDLKIS